MSFARALTQRFTETGGKGGRQCEPLPNEKPVAVLRVQVVGCKDLLAADFNGTSDPFVALTFSGKREKTPAINKNLSPVYDPKTATFDFPLYLSVVEKVGSLLELVVWDKDFIGKDYLGEVALTSRDWFKHNGGQAALDFSGSGNKDFWLPLDSSEPTKPAKGAIHLKLGFVNPPNVAHCDFAAAYTSVKEKSESGAGALHSAPPNQAMGTLGEGASAGDSDGEEEEFKSTRKLPSFRLNWAGTKIDYSFQKHRDVAGVILLELRSAKDLPKLAAGIGKGGAWDMDPFAVVDYGTKQARTKVVRHSLEPEWNEKIMFHVRKHEIDANGAIQFSIRDWDQFGTTDHVGDASLPLATLIGRVPAPDPKTGLYKEDMNITHGMYEISLPLTPGKETKSESGANPCIQISAKYEPHAAFRQRFWRANLHAFDANKNAQFSYNEINAFLKSLGLSLNAPVVKGFFKDHGKTAGKDELTLDETVQCLEGAIGIALEKGVQPQWSDGPVEKLDESKPTPAAQPAQPAQPKPTPTPAAPPKVEPTPSSGTNGHADPSHHAKKPKHKPAKPAGPPKKSTVTFEIRGHTQVTEGEHIYIVGNLAELGGWNPDKAIKLSCGTEPVWSTHVELLADKPFSYKYIRKTPGKKQAWEESPFVDRRLHTPTSGTLKVNDSWNVPTNFWLPLGTHAKSPLTKA